MAASNCAVDRSAGAYGGRPSAGCNRWLCGRNGVDDVSRGTAAESCDADTDLLGVGRDGDPVRVLWVSPGSVYLCVYGRRGTVLVLACWGQELFHEHRECADC